MKEINLVAGEEKKIIELNRIAVKFRKISLLVLILFIVLVSGLMFYFFNIDKKNRTNEEKISGLKRTIEKFDKTESYLIQKQDRINNIEQIKSALFSYSDFFKDIENLTIPEVLINKIEFSGNNIKINVSCTNSKILSNLYEQIFLLAKNNKFNNVLIGNVSSMQEGVYDVNFVLVR